MAIAAAALIFAANLGQIGASCIVNNDYNFVEHGSATVKQVVSYGSYRTLYFSSIPNNLIFAHLFTHSAAAARVAIVLVGMLPVSLLWYRICRTCLKLPAFPAFAASVLPHVISGQTLIPIFINGSYQTYALLPSLAFLLMSHRFLGSNRGYARAGLPLFLLVVSFFSTEVSLFLCVPIFTWLFLVFPGALRRRVLALALASAAAGLARLAVYHLQAKTIANEVRPSGMYAFRFKMWVSSFSFAREFHNGFLLFFAAVVLVSLILLLALHVRGRRRRGRGVSTEAEERWSAILIFGLLWMFFAGVPFVVLSAHPFSSRYGYPATFGFTLLLAALPAYGTERGWVPSRGVAAAFVLLLAWSCADKLATTRALYAPSADLAARITADLKPLAFPPNSQILITGGKLNPLGTGSIWSWSSGFLRYHLKRNDLSGLIGSPRSFYDPFARWTGSWDKGSLMTGLSLSKPLFCFDYREGAGGLTAKNFVLRWVPDRTDDAWQLYRAESGTGRLSLFAADVGKATYHAQVDRMVRDGIGLEAIYGGAERASAR